LQAAIAALHAEAEDAAQTDWAQIAALYDELARITRPRSCCLNGAVALGNMSEGAERGLAMIDELGGSGALDRYHLYHAARADLLRDSDRGLRPPTLSRALSLTANGIERSFLERRLAALYAPLAGCGRHERYATLPYASAQFLCHPGFERAGLRPARHRLDPRTRCRSRSMSSRCGATRTSSSSSTAASRGPRCCSDAVAAILGRAMPARGAPHPRRDRFLGVVEERAHVALDLSPIEAPSKWCVPRPWRRAVDEAQVRFTDLPPARGTDRAARGALLALARRCCSGMPAIASAD